MEEERSKANVISPGCRSETAVWEENKELLLLLGHEDIREILMVGILPFFLKTRDKFFKLISSSPKILKDFVFSQTLPSSEPEFKI